MLNHLTTCLFDIVKRCRRLFPCSLQCCRSCGRRHLSVITTPASRAVIDYRMTRHSAGSRILSSGPREFFSGHSPRKWQSRWEYRTLATSFISLSLRRWAKDASTTDKACRKPGLEEFSGNGACTLSLGINILRSNVSCFIVRAYLASRVAVAPVPHGHAEDGCWAQPDRLVRYETLLLRHDPLDPRIYSMHRGLELSILWFGCVSPQSRPAQQVVAVGWKPLCRAHWANRFDLLVLGISLASFFPAEFPGNRAALLIDGHPLVSDILELPRAIRVLRCGSIPISSRDPMCHR